MAGYNGFSMSNNAVRAYRSGKLPASKMAAFIGGGATAAGIAAVMQPREWHHTSKQYNRTNFYDLDADIEDRAENDEITIEEAEARVIDQVRAASAAAKPKSSEAFAADVRWLEWVGTKSHPRAIERFAEDVQVVQKGKSFTITLTDGTSFRKFEGTNGFVVVRK